MFCSKNYKGSSKGMESEAALRAVNCLFKEKNVTIEKVILDDDSTTKSLLVHSLKEQGIPRSNWPRYPSGSIKPDNGKLPLDHPKIEFLADINHQVRSFGKQVWGLYYAPKSVCDISKHAVMRLKRNYAYCLFQGKSKSSFEDFKTSTGAVIDHVFDSHELCGKWCKAKSMTMKEKKEKQMLFYNKSRDSKLYKKITEATATYFTEKGLKEVFHEGTTNKNESMTFLSQNFFQRTNIYKKQNVQRGV